MLLVERFGGQYDGVRASEASTGSSELRSDGVLRNWVPMGEEVDDLHRYTITREGWEASR